MYICKIKKINKLYTIFILYIPIFLLSSSSNIYEKSEFDPMDAGGIRFDSVDALETEDLKSFILDMEEHVSVFNMDEYKDKLVTFQFSLDSSETFDTVVHFAG